MSLWNSHEPAEHLGLPGVAVLHHEGAQLHYPLLLDTVQIQILAHQGWRWVRHRIIVVLKLPTIVLFFLLQAFCFQQIETKNCKRNPWSQNAELVCRNKRLQMCETANVKPRYLQTDSLAECIKWLLISGCLNLIKISKRF